MNQSSDGCPRHRPARTSPWPALAGGQRTRVPCDVACGGVSLPEGGMDGGGGMQMKTEWHTDAHAVHPALQVGVLFCVWLDRK